VKLFGDVHHETFHRIYIYTYVNAVKENSLTPPRPGKAKTAGDPTESGGGLWFTG
jgi:hypothetical protein